MKKESRPDYMPPEISIVSTTYRSRPFLEQFLARCLEALSDIGCDHFEILLVNDGSPDDSLDYALERQENIPQLVVATFRAISVTITRFRPGCSTRMET